MPETRTRARSHPIVAGCGLLMLLATAAYAPCALAQPAETLHKVVIVSRHGVRSPLTNAAESDQWSRQPWPAWSVAPGELTPRGAQLATLMGRYYRAYLATQGAMPPEGCPSSGSLYFYADVTQRTRRTAQALLEGLAPGCGFTPRSLADAKIDPLFHPLEAGVCTIDPLGAQIRVLERASGNLNNLARDLKAPFETLQAALDCCKPTLCAAFGRDATCKLTDLPTALSPRPEGAGLGLIGALGIASSASEAMLLEYADGRPMADVGWGRITPVQLAQVMRLHTEQFNLLERTPYLAKRQGSALLARVAQIVTSARALGFGVPDPAVRDAKFVAFVGHDTNLWNLAGMLDVSWLQPPYQRNQTPPVGALMFEVREGDDRKLRVYASYIAQSLEQMRNASPLTPDTPPARTALRIPGCSANTPGHPCTLEEFAIAVRNVLDRDCVN